MARAGWKWGVAGVFAVATLYLACWPIDAQPQGWTPPPGVAREGSWAPNDALASPTRHVEGEGIGPEDLTFDDEGHVYTGLADGRILRAAPDGSKPYTFATLNEGRPLGMAFAPDGDLIVADGHGGIVAVDPQGQVRDVVTEVDGEPLLFADDVDVAADGTIWFSEASRRFDVEHAPLDAVEGVPTGRLIAFDPASGATKVHLEALRYANGVSLGPDDAYVLVNETFGYRIARLWLTGPQAGSHDLFVEGLPGLPDNVHVDEEGNAWVALIKDRSAILDAISPYPGLRAVLFRLPEAWLPVPPPIAWVAVFDANGVLRTQLRGEGTFGDVTTAKPHGERLWLGSLSMNALASVERPSL